MGSSGFLCSLGSSGQCPVQGWLCCVRSEHQGAETGATVPGCVRWQCSSSPDPAPGRAPRSPAEKEHVTPRTFTPRHEAAEAGHRDPRALREGKSPSQHCPARVQMHRELLALPSCLACQQLSPWGQRKGEKCRLSVRAWSTGLSPGREESRRSVLSCTRSLNSTTLSFGLTHKHNSQISRTLPQGSKHYLDKQMV